MKPLRLNPEELVTAALKLEPRSRAEVAQRLIESLDELSPAENEKIWLAASSAQNGFDAVGAAVGDEGDGGGVDL